MLQGTGICSSTLELNHALFSPSSTLFPGSTHQFSSSHLHSGTPCYWPAVFLLKHSILRLTVLFGPLTYPGEMQTS